ncbi:MAG: BON domain-containing protein [Terriglobales bacterium]
MKGKTVVLGLAFGLMLGLAAGAAPLPAPPQKAAATQALDGQISRYLQDQYANKKTLADVRVSVNDRVVTLRGSVPDYRAYLEANHIARQVGSVDGIIDHLTVNAPYVPDEKLKNQIATRLAYDRLGMGQIFNSLTLEVHDGVVTVGGNVHDYASRDSALDIIANTRGVKAVRDHIQVAPTSIFDDQTRVAVARAIYRNPTLRRYALNPAHPIRIVVDNGHVTLDGVVASQLDKTVAGHAAKVVPNVFSVKNNLIVAPGS